MAAKLLCYFAPQAAIVVELRAALWRACSLRRLVEVEQKVRGRVRLAPVRALLGVRAKCFYFYFWPELKLFAKLIGLLADWLAKWLAKWLARSPR